MRIPDYTPYTRCGLAEDGMTDLFGRLHTAGNGGMQSCEIILLHEGADLVGVHGFERVQQARGDALAADADAAQWVDGSAWHNYGGSVSELDNIRAAAPDKTIYFTEASIGTWNYNFESCVIDDFESIFLGTLSRMGRGVLLWNLMLDDKGAPNRPGGCTTCYGAIEISSSDYKTLKYNSHYYDLAQCAKVIRPGAVRIGTSGYTAPGLTYLAFANPDGSKAFVALNRNSSEQTVAVYESADRSFKYTIPAKSIASFRWGAGAEN